jgi:hypothetical protein
VVIAAIMGAVITVVMDFMRGMHIMATMLIVRRGVNTVMVAVLLTLRFPVRLICLFRHVVHHYFL